MKLLAAIALLSISLTSFSQQNSWSKWNWLLGTWHGEGTGQPGQGGGTFSFSADLDNNIVVRKSHSEYPGNDNKQKLVHDDLMIVYSDADGNPSKAIYFDNEKHVINYSITYAGKTITLISEKIPGAPVFRLTYTLIKENLVNTKFEMSQDGEKFMTYVEGNSMKE